MSKDPRELLFSFVTFALASLWAYFNASGLSFTTALSLSFGLSIFALITAVRCFDRADLWVQHSISLTAPFALLALGGLAFPLSPHSWLSAISGLIAAVPLSLLAFIVSRPQPDIRRSPLTLCCAACHYDLTGLDTEVLCPECGSNHRQMRLLERE